MKNSTSQGCPFCHNQARWWDYLTAGARHLFSGKNRDRLMSLSVEKIDDNPYQPRRFIRMEESYENLKTSVREYGVIVPIIVNRKNKGRFTLVAGQRRLRAAREVGLTHVPAIVRRLSLRKMMEIAYLENLHREDLSSIDVVKMFDRIRRRYPGLDSNGLASTMGLDVHKLEEARELLKWPALLQEALQGALIDVDRAHVLLELKDERVLQECLEIVSMGELSLEETREMVDRVLRKEPPYVAAEGSRHFHAPSCPYAQLIPEEKRSSFYSKKEALRRGKIACMQCL